MQRDFFQDKAKEWNNPAKIKDTKGFVEYVKENIKIDRDSILCDFGCGTGVIGLSFVSQVRHVVFIDLSPAMLEVLREDISKQSITNCTVVNHDINSYDGEKVDVLLSHMVFHHVENLESTIKGIFDALKEGGKAFLVDLRPEDGSFHAPEAVPHNGFDPSQLEALFVKSGFKAVKIVDYPALNKPGPDGNVREYPRFLLEIQK
ncbi:S-adenosylmethionine-dependent methyltransferase [Tritrichomonas foetus]|uniref:S-adenosylmethionine-dependent methyltransferase n=1 Tax=Tritrichomonas foetus TaxID=1144522 RepID=A0A1J4J3M7_9EUKA|nr:S-adenosylmethionine-dependent methyltransferase [Tritrichomonas foetus]|eukprot:OHS94030.1 S-adenosylmethionine-dependent methyltransferase [Tritrichomonas foetus]